MGRSTRARAGLTVLVATVVLVAGGCGGDGGGESAPDPQQAPAGAATTAAADASTALRDRCLSGFPEPELVEAHRIDGAPGIDLQAGVFPAEGSEVAMLLLHQIGGAGLCGWGAFATEAAHRGVASVAVDLCGYGESECAERWMGDPTHQVEVAAEWTRRELGVRRVVLVGASMGGSQTVRAVAGGAPVQAWADLSGPSAWDGVALLPLADRVESPGLVVQARSDGAAEYDRARQLADATGARFVDGGAGHGWELVTTVDGRITRTGRTLLAFVRG